MLVDSLTSLFSLPEMLQGNFHPGARHFKATGAGFNPKVKSL